MQTPTWLKYSTKSDNKQEFISSLLTQRTSVQQVQTDTFNFLLSLQQYLQSEAMFRGPKSVKKLQCATTLTITTPPSSLYDFLPERDYVTFRSLLQQICLSSVKFVCPTQGLKLLAIFLCHFVPQPSFDLCAKLYRDRLRGTHPLWDIKCKRGSKIEQWWTLKRLYLISVMFMYLIS